MKKKYSYILIVAVLVLAAVIVTFTLKYKSKAKQDESLKHANALHSNTCWVDHVYIFSLKYDSYDLPVFEFVLNEDGTFSPYDDQANPCHYTGNGFLIDSLGACLISRNLAEPWNHLTPSQLENFNKMADEFRKKYNVPDLPYTLGGISLGIYVCLGDVKDMIEYSPTNCGTDDSEKMSAIILPHHRILLNGLHSFSPVGIPIQDESNMVYVLNKNPDLEGVNRINLISVLDNVGFKYVNKDVDDEIIFSDSVKNFNEGAMVLNQDALLIGPLRFEKGKWHLSSINGLSYRNSNTDSVSFQVWQYENFSWHITASIDPEMDLEEQSDVELGPDTEAPVLTISCQSISVAGENISLSGNCSDNIEVVNISWENNFGENGSVPSISPIGKGNYFWTIENIVIHEGSNVITIRATDEAGNIKSESCTIEGLPQYRKMDNGF